MSFAKAIDAALKEIKTILSQGDKTDQKYARTHKRAHKKIKDTAPSEERGQRRWKSEAPEADRLVP